MDIRKAYTLFQLVDQRRVTPEALVQVAELAGVDVPAAKLETLATVWREKGHAAVIPQVIELALTSPRRAKPVAEPGVARCPHCMKVFLNSEEFIE